MLATSLFTAKPTAPEGGTELGAPEGGAELGSARVSARGPVMAGWESRVADFFWDIGIFAAEGEPSMTRQPVSLALLRPAAYRLRATGHRAGPFMVSVGRAWRARASGW